MPVAQRAVGLVKRKQHRLGVHVVAEGEQAGRGPRIGKALAVAVGERGPVFVVVALRDRQRRDRPRQQGADGARPEQAAAERRGACHDGRLPAGLGIGFQKNLRRARLQSQEQRVRLRADHGPCDSRSVARAGGNPVPRQHLAAERAVVQHEAHELRVGQRIVLGDRDDRADALLLVGVAPEPRDPLHAVGIEAEEIVRRRAQGRVLRRRSAVDERHVRRALRELPDRDALDPREWADENAGAAVDQRTRLRDDRVRSPVGRLDECFDGPLAGASLVLAQGKLVAAQGIPPERLERALERGEDADLEGLGVRFRREFDRQQQGEEDRRCHEAHRMTGHPPAARAPRWRRHLRHAVPIMLITYWLSNVLKYSLRVSRLVQHHHKTL